jgi:hypothetical protein
MHRPSAIESKRAPLLAIVRGLCAGIGLTEGATIDRLPRLVHRYVLGILRKAESATRRLIVAAARDIVVEPAEPRSSKPRQKPMPKSDGDARPKRKRRPLFNLFDPLKRFCPPLQEEAPQAGAPHQHRRSWLQSADPLVSRNLAAGAISAGCRGKSR